jgi:hypothetical protein
MADHICPNVPEEPDLGSNHVHDEKAISSRAHATDPVEECRGTFPL